jgi:DUF4097 and DUF4098 domain-containing protein YvlB
MLDIRTPTTLGPAVLGSLLALLLAASAHGQVTQDFHRTVPLSTNGRVSLNNVNGNVEITGWDRNEVQIDAVKKARDQQRLDEARIEVNTTGDSVEIKTHYPEGLLSANNNPASVHYQLHVPQNARLDRVDLVNGSLTVERVSGEVSATLVNGKLRVDDLAGRADLSTVNGGIEANYASLNNVREIKLKSVNGAIELGLPDSPNAEIKASTVSGGIRTEFPLEVRGGYVGRNLTGTLGNGGAPIALSNVNGSIHIGSRHGSL